MDFWPDVVDDGLAKTHAERFGDFMTCSAEDPQQSGQSVTTVFSFY